MYAMLSDILTWTIPVLAEIYGRKEDRRMAAATEMGIAQILAGKSVEFYIFEITLGDDRIVKTADLSQRSAVCKKTPAHFLLRLIRE